MGLFDLDPFVTQPVSVIWRCLRSSVSDQFMLIKPKQSEPVTLCALHSGPIQLSKTLLMAKIFDRRNKENILLLQIFPADVRTVSRDVSCSVFPPRVRVACPDLISDLEPRHRMISILNDMIHWYVLLLICSGPVINILHKWPLPPQCSVWINSRVQQNNFAAWASLIPQINELRVFLKTLCVDVSVTTCIVLHIFLASLRYFLLTKKTQKKTFTFIYMTNLFIEILLATEI